MQTLPNTNGFTLIEVLITISILGIIGSVGFMSLGSSSREVALDNSYATVITAFESARGNAMRGAGGRSVEISADGKSVITETATLPLPPGVTVTPAGIVTFERISGRAPSSETFTLTTSDNTRTITVTPEGYVE